MAERQLREASSRCVEAAGRLHPSRSPARRRPTEQIAQAQAHARRGQTITPGRVRAAQGEGTGLTWRARLTSADLLRIRQPRADVRRPLRHLVRGAAGTRPRHDPRVAVLHRADPAADPGLRGAPDQQRQRRRRRHHPTLRPHRRRGAIGGGRLRPVGAQQRGCRQPVPPAVLRGLADPQAAAALPPGVRPAAAAGPPELAQRGVRASRRSSWRSPCSTSSAPSCGRCRSS